MGGANVRAGIRGEEGPIRAREGSEEPRGLDARGRRLRRMLTGTARSPGAETIAERVTLGAWSRVAKDVAGMRWL